MPLGVDYYEYSKNVTNTTNEIWKICVILHKIFMGPFSTSYFHSMISVFGSGALVSQNMIDQCGSSGIMCQSYIIILLKKSNPIFLTPAVSFMIEIFIQIISQLFLTRFNLPDLFLLLVPSFLQFSSKTQWPFWGIFAQKVFETNMQ